MWFDYVRCVFPLPPQHGESVCNLFGRIGGDSDLSERGLEVNTLYIAIRGDNWRGHWRGGGGHQRSGL